MDAKVLSRMAVQVLVLGEPPDKRHQEVDMLVVAMVGLEKE